MANLVPFGTLDVGARFRATHSPMVMVKKQPERPTATGPEGEPIPAQYNAYNEEEPRSDHYFIYAEEMVEPL